MAVETAHETTFEWLLKEQDYTHSNSSTSERNTFRLEARERFTHWLQNGDGIFHISGKPGAGKSTLMKFLCKSPLTRHYLESWSKSKTLVFAKAFFWRLGSENQKSLKGLISTLLYEILSAAPSLIPVALPFHWGRVQFANSMITIELDEIEQAFNNLLTSQVTFEEHKIVFFIDGLDEYQGRHTELVKKFFSWTSLNPENLKICVASREWNEFTIGFAECPKLRIHECTHEDITLFVNHRIKTYSENLDAVNQDSLGFLAEKITSKAEGVFLWVRLALNATEDGILNGDGVSDLEEKIDAFPNELGALYQHLFDSIHISDRRKVFETLRMASHMAPKVKLRLLHFWFLNEVIADPDFAIKMPIAEASEECLAKTFKTTLRQIYGRCKGLLEVCPVALPSGHPSDTYAPLPSDGEVRFMHSTAYEFLNQSHIKQAIDNVVGHVDFFHRICQTFLASIKFANEPWYFHHHVENVDSPFNEQLSQLLDAAIGDENIFDPISGASQRHIQFLNFLDEMEIVTMARLRSRLVYKHVNDYLIGYGDNSNKTITCYIPTSPQTHIQSLAAKYLVHEFLGRKGATWLKSISGGSNLPIPKEHAIDDLAIIIFSDNNVLDALFKETRCNRLCDMLELCLSRGISPNYVSQSDGLTFFDYMLLVFMYRTYTTSDQIVYPIRLLEIALRYGATSQLRLCFGPIYEHKSTGEVVIIVKLGLGPANKDRKDPKWESKSNYIVGTSPLALFAKRRGWVVTFRDLLELWAPNDYKTLQSLLDRNSNGYVASELSANRPPGRSSFSEYRLKGVWEKADFTSWYLDGRGALRRRDIEKDFKEISDISM